MDKLTALGYKPNDPQGPDEINAQIQNIYNKRYSEGLAASRGNATIVYKYHYHNTTTCPHDTTYPTVNKTPPGKCDFKGSTWSQESIVQTCPKCGSNTNSWYLGGNWAYMCSNYAEPEPVPDYSRPKYTWKCGYNDGQIIGATITFN